LWIDRDLSWLDFNERVLAEALDPRTPLLERVKFLAIFTSNLDEFFKKRIAVLRERLTPARLALLQQIREKLIPLLQRQAKCFRGRLYRNWLFTASTCVIGKSSHRGSRMRLPNISMNMSRQL
jgi:polyphosphate kinase